MWLGGPNAAAERRASADAHIKRIKEARAADTLERRSKLRLRGLRATKGVRPRKSTETADQEAPGLGAEASGIESPPTGYGKRQR